MVETSGEEFTSELKEKFKSAFNEKSSLKDFVYNNDMSKIIFMHTEGFLLYIYIYLHYF